MTAVAARAAPVPAAGADRIARSDFDRLARIVGQRFGLLLTPARVVTVEGRLRRRVRALGLPSIDAYCRLLFDEGALEAELDALADALTTQKTDFFREPEHFDLIARRFLPEALAAATAARPRLKVWSAAASTGPEAYSAAMLLEDLSAARRRFDYAVLGTDLCGEALAVARRAVYPEAMAAPAPPAYRRAFFMRSREGGLVRVAPEIRARARFARLNLMDPRYPVDGDVDIAFLRNVLIYFSRQDQAAVTERVLGRLRPGGLLLLGHAESMACRSALARQIAPSAFLKL